MSRAGHFVFRAPLFCAMFLIAPPRVGADVRYEQTSRITGGSILRVAGIVGDQLTRPVTTSIAVKAHRMMHASGSLETIVDLDAKSITQIDLAQHRYWTASFDDLTKLEANATKPQISNIRLSIRDGGGQKQLLDFPTRERILNLSMEVRNPRTGVSSDAEVNSDMFVCTVMPGVMEVRDFFRKMAGVAWYPGTVPGVSDMPVFRALGDAYRTNRDLTGLPLATYLTVTGSIPGVAQQHSGSPLIEMTLEVNSWSNRPLDDGLFRMPAGLKKVPPPAPK